MSLENKDQAALEMFKHYSGVRFLMLPLFFTSMGAILVAYWTVLSNGVPTPALLRWVAFGGLLLSLFFSVYEYRLSETLLRVSTALPESMATIKHKRHFGAVTVATLMLYGVPSLFWLWRICEHT